MRARHLFAAGALAVTAACGSSPSIPPLPQQLRSLDQREAGCATCHSTGRAKLLDPTVNATPAEHPPLAVMEILRDMRLRRELR